MLQFFVQNCGRISNDAIRGITLRKWRHQVVYAQHGFLSVSTPILRRLQLLVIFQRPYIMVQCRFDRPKRHTPELVPPLTQVCMGAPLEFFLYLSTFKRYSTMFGWKFPQRVPIIVFFYGLLAPYTLFDNDTTPSKKALPYAWPRANRLTERV